MNLVTEFFTILNCAKLYHWNTYSHPRHVSTDKFVNELTTLTDTFIETYIGKLFKENNYSLNTFSKIPANQRSYKLNLQIHNDKSILTFLDDFCKFLTDTVPTYLSDSDTDLFNIRDEMLGLTKQTLYLYTLN